MDINHFQLAFGLSVAYIGHTIARQTEEWESLLGCALVAMGIFSTISALIDLEIIF